MPARGLTLSELAAVGEEAGLDPGLVRRAAALAPTAPTRLSEVLLGAHPKHSLRARVPGRLEPSRHGELTDLCETTFSRRGTTEGDDGRFVWTEDHGPGRSRVAVLRKNGESEVTVEADRQGWSLLAALGSAALTVVGLQPLGGVVGLVTSLGPLAGVLLPIVTAALVFRGIHPRLNRGLAGKVEKVALGALALVEPQG